MSVGMRRLAVCGWLSLGAAIVNWLWLRHEASGPLLWAAMLVPILALLPGMMFDWRHAYALPMLASVVYEVVGLMELISSAADRGPAVILTGAALFAFFAAIPATRQARRRETI